jgi:hypothetical protein
VDAETLGRAGGDRSLDEANPEDAVIPSSVPQAASSSSAADPDGVVPQQAAGNLTSRRDERDLQPDGLHLAIDVGPPTSSEHAEAETPAAGGDRSLDDAEPGEAVTPSSVPQPSPSPSVADPEGVVSQQAAGNGIDNSRSDEQDRQPEPDGLHLAIDVGSPTSSGRVDADARH